MMKSAMARPETTSIAVTGRDAPPSLATTPCTRLAGAALGVGEAEHRHHGSRDHFEHQEDAGDPGVGTQVQQTGQGGEHHHPGVGGLRRYMDQWSEVVRGTHGDHRRHDHHDQQRQHEHQPSGEVGRSGW